jgi:hypothetical protein
VQVQADPALGNRIIVTNDKGIGARGPASTIAKGPKTKPAKSHNTYDDTGSVTMFTLPSAAALKTDTQTVFTDNAWNMLPAINGGSADTVPAVIPKKLGGTSPIKHVVVIVKENRTYDQVLGDLGVGNGDPALAQFGKHVTPNLHALARRFGDLDNFYDEGTLSADGHNWLIQANANDYNEKEFGAFRHRAATPSPTSVTASCGTPPSGPGSRCRCSASTPTTRLPSLRRRGMSGTRTRRSWRARPRASCPCPPTSSRPPATSHR